MPPVIVYAPSIPTTAPSASAKNVASVPPVALAKAADSQWCSSWDSACSRVEVNTPGLSAIAAKRTCRSRGPSSTAIRRTTTFFGRAHL